MSGVGLQVELHGIERLNIGIERLQGLGRNSELFDRIGGVIHEQVTDRFLRSKTDPDGNAWVDWSEAYAKTREGNHSLLMNEGNLEESIAYIASDDEVVIGSNEDYAAVQHSRREYLGLNDKDWDEIGDVVESFIDELLS